MKSLPLRVTTDRSTKKRSTVIAIVLAGVLSSACTSSSDSCDDLEGYITHTVTELTGIESASVLKYNANTGVSESVDQLSGTEFSNLSIEVELSWVAEQHRFRAPNTFIQSLLNWFIPPAMACSLAPFHEDYQPVVVDISIHSDNDLNADFVAGTNLSTVFEAADLMTASNSLQEASDLGNLLSARVYSLRPTWQNGALTTTPTTPSTHVFTITVTMNDGRAYSMRTPEFLLSGT